jgi:Protein of unknown function (DUF1064)
MSQWTDADVMAHNARLGKKARKNTLMDVSATSLKVFEAMLDHPVAAKPSKYRNVKTITPDGEKFDSRAEADYWLLLRARAEAGEIINLRRQVPFGLYCPAPAEHHPPEWFALDGKITVQVCEYVADFVWQEKDGRLIVADKKSPATAKNRLYALKKKWMALQYGIEILEV